MTTPRIPVPEGVTPPFTSDAYKYLEDVNGKHIAVGIGFADWMASVLTAYYADTPPQQATTTVPQFVVVNCSESVDTTTVPVARITQLTPNTVHLTDDWEIEITPAEYARLKSILAPGQ